MRYAAHLSAREAAGTVRSIQRHVPFDLHVNGYAIGVYRADFVFEERVDLTSTLFADNHAWRQVVADCKSPVTRARMDSRILRRLMHAVHGVAIRDIAPRDLDKEF